MIGVDEVGLGVLAGPIAVSAVVLPPGYKNSAIKDSKSIKSYAKLYQIAAEIETVALAHITHFVSVGSINKLGTWNAWELLVNEVIFYMRSKVGFNTQVILDGTRVPKGQYKLDARAKADTLFPCVSAASIIAKMRRHVYMLWLHKKYPLYGYDTSDGYGTLAHIENVIAIGPSKHHRKQATETAVRNYLRKRRHELPTHQG